MSSTRHGSERRHAPHLAQTYLTYSRSLLVAALGATAVLLIALVAVTRFGLGESVIDRSYATDLLVVSTALLILVDTMVAASMALLFLLSRLER